jgi:Zn-dependent protease
MMRFSETEIEHLLKAWIAVSLAFAILLSNGKILSKEFGSMLIISAIAVGGGFLLHEIGHKYVAQKYNCFAEFRAFNSMLILAILMSFLGFIFLAPGAVMIQGHVTRERNGKISIAGPLVNIALAIIFLGLSFLATSSFFSSLFKYGLMINAWLALFNMFPIFNLDGKKVLKWSKPIYFLTLGISIGILLLSFVISN